MPIEKSDYIWMDGEFVPWDEAKIHVLSHALHYGTGVFEGIRAYWNGSNLLVFRLKDHIQRFINSMKIHWMSLPYGPEDLVEITLTLLRKNRLKTSSYIRPIAFRGLGEFGLNPMGSPVQCAIAAFPLGAYLKEGGVRVCTSVWRRVPDESMPSTAKTCGAYVTSTLAKAEALMRGFDEAILLDSRGFLSEGSGENLFLVIDGMIHTPSVASSILQGITRKTVIEIAKDEGFQVIERDILKSELYTCEEAFFTGTAAEITPILEADNRIIGGGSIGKVTLILRDILSKAALGKIERYKKWTTPVY
ncbi:MAG: branched-chain amino acid transaminase [Candidatus Bathyarchaeia archaeon]|nr:branched-chain amino acid transaminase [Candidatus Bathyarchaeota archaeon]